MDGADGWLRLTAHPVIAVTAVDGGVPFTWRGRPLTARPGEVISSALTAAGEIVFGRHPADGAALGLFCANGQCASCTVIADGVPVKACMTPVEPGMAVEPADSLPRLPSNGRAATSSTAVLRVDALVIGAGPAGMAAAIELGQAGVTALVVDDKDRPGGKLVLQTHKFFGSREQTSAGTRGVDIAAAMAARLSALETVELWTGATAVGAFADGRVGIARDRHYWLVEPRALLVATGARERQLVFPGSTLPGVLGAGAFQTLLNRDQVIPCSRLLVVGGGNVGLIAAYHALQAGITVVGLVEVMPQPGGYRVHADKLRRLGVPLYASHTIVAAHGDDRVEAATIAAVDGAGMPRPGTETTFEVDGVLVAAGLAPLDGLALQAAECGIPVFTAGDAAEVAEASAASVGGRIAGRRILHRLGLTGTPPPPEWERLQTALKSRPGRVHPELRPEPGWEVFPVLRCTQEIPCNPCAAVCRRQAIVLDGDPLTGTPRYTGEGCTGCTRCLSICPGLAITLVDRRGDSQRPLVTIPFEMPQPIAPGMRVTATGSDGAVVGQFEVTAVRDRRSQDRTRLVTIRTTAATAGLIAGIRVVPPEEVRPTVRAAPVPPTDQAVLCRCEHVTTGQVREAVRSGIHDVNELKGMVRVCMGACCGTGCPEHVSRILRDEGVPDTEVTPATRRSPVVEVPLGVFAAGSGRTA